MLALRHFDRCFFFQGLGTDHVALLLPYPTDAADFLAPRQRTTVLHPLDYQVSRRAMEEWRAVNALHAGGVKLHSGRLRGSLQSDHRGMMKYVCSTISLFIRFMFPIASPGDGVQASPGAAFGR